MSISDNKKVAKNTLVLYIRMIITMLISMWVSRLVLNALGFTDQGLYNVVGGVIGFSALITASISGSITRFITFQIGKGDHEKVNEAVQNGITVQWVLAGIVIIAGETLGLWFVNSELVIPPDRLFAVNVVYQFALFNVALSLLTSAANALVIAHEKMNIFAAVSITNSIISLAIALAITYSPIDRLILYAFLQFVNILGVRVFYYFYVSRTFRNIKLKFGFKKEIFYPIFLFAGWNGIGTAAAILRSSGTSVLLNMFGGPVANTINGIAGSVNNIATIFVSDFTTAYTPQITKRYAAEEHQSLISFINQCSKLSYILIAVISIPVMFNMEPLLVLWLKKIPDGVVPFGVLVIIFSMIESLSRPLIQAKCATGDIRNYQIVVGGILLLTLPLTYLFFKLNLPLYYSYVSIVITSSVALIARLVMLKGDIPFWSSWVFFKRTLTPCMMATILALIVPAILHFTLPKTLPSTFFQFTIEAIWTAGCLFFIALNKTEQQTMIGMIKKVRAKFM